MSIDWITVAAQLANFLVLVWLLKRFLYRPILDGIDAREAEISERMQLARHVQEKAEAVQADYHDRLGALQNEQASVVDAARQEAEAQRDALLAEAHERIERERAAWQTHLDEEARSFATRMHRAGGQALLALTRKALIDLADDTLEARIAAHLARQIKPMKDALADAAGAGDMALVTSHKDLPQAVRDVIAAELHGLFPEIALRFETDAAQSPGLALQLGGAQLAWTVDTYIDGLDALVAEQMAKGTDRKGQADGR